MSEKLILSIFVIGISCSLLQAQEYYLDSTFRQSLNGNVKTEKYYYNTDFTINQIDKGSNISKYSYPNNKTIEVDIVVKSTDEKYGGIHYKYGNQGELLSEVFYGIDDNDEEDPYLGNSYTYNDDGLLTQHTFSKEYFIGYYEYYSEYSDISYEYNEDGNITKETIEYYVDGLDITLNTWDGNDLIKATRHYTSEVDDIRDTTTYDVVQTGTEWRALNKNYFTDISEPTCDSLFYLQLPEFTRSYRKYSSDCTAFSFGSYSQEYINNSELVPFDSLILGTMDSEGNHQSYRERTLYNIDLDESQGRALVTESRLYYHSDGEFDFEIIKQFFYRKSPHLFEEKNPEMEIAEVAAYPTPVITGGLITSFYGTSIADKAILSDQVGRVIETYDLDRTSEFFQFNAPYRPGMYFLTFYNLDKRVTRAKKIMVRE